MDVSEIEEAFARAGENIRSRMYDHMFAFDPFSALIFGDQDDPERKAINDERHALDWERMCSPEPFSDDLRSRLDAFQKRENAFIERIKKERKERGPIQ